VSSTQIIESSDNLFAGQLVKLVDVLLLTPVDGQATERGSNLLGVDSGRELTGLFRASRQFVEAFQLADQGHAVFALPLLSQFFDKVSDKRVGFAVEQFIRMVPRRVGSVSGKSRALCIAVSSLNIVSSEFPLPVGEASNLLCQGQSPIGFSTGFGFSEAKSRARRTRSGPNGPNWAENYSTKTMLVPLVPLVPPFPKNFFKKLLPVEKVICVNQSKILSCMAWDNMRLFINSSLSGRGPRFKFNGDIP